MPTYQHALAKHLDRYRREVLCVRTPGVFRYRGRDVTRGHILPRALRWLNAPEPFRKAIHEYVRARPAIRLHRYFHHLNSSQAFAFNLFMPFAAHAPGALASALGTTAIRHASFEVVPLRHERTNVDVSWRGKRGDLTYCEVKLSESAFGSAEPDADHRRRLARTYAPALREHLAPSALEPAAFFDGYQVFRNLYLAARVRQSRLVFLLPRANQSANDHLRGTLSLVRSPLRDRIRVCYVEDVLSDLASSSNDLAWYASLLQEKYVPSAF